MAGVMKDSEVEWIGEIPEEWDISKVKYIGRYINGYAFKPDQWGQDGLPIIRIQNLSGSSKSINYFDGKISDDYLIDDGDILISWSATLDAFIWNYGKGWLNQHIFKAIPNVQKIHKSYFFHLMKIAMLNMSSDKHGSAMQHVTNQIFGNFQVPLPSLSEQKLIADFLDEKCAEIDKLSEDIQKQIDILNNYKKSVITRAVTKGLDPNAEMKDSGIEWIGTIPKSWSLIRLKNAAWLKGRIGWQGLRADEFKDDESLPYLITGTDFYNGIVNWDTCVHITEERFNQDRNIQIKEDDLLITKDGTIGKVAIAKKCPQRVSLNSGIFIIRNIGKYKYYSRFMYYVLQSDEFIEWYSVANAGNSTILHLNQEKFYNFVFALPDIESQKYIAERLDVKCAHIDYSISEKYDQLSKLDSYKKSIIYEYVTGKKRVKGVL